MLDRDLAQLYGVKAFRLREQVKRNANKFPQHFMFQLTAQEVEIMLTKSAMPPNLVKMDFLLSVNMAYLCRQMC